GLNSQPGGTGVPPVRIAPQTPPTSTPARQMRDVRASPTAHTVAPGYPAPMTPPLALLTLAMAITPALAPPDEDGYEWAVITHPGNRDTIPEETPFRPDVPIGGVDYVFRIATTEVTVGQWFEFVQAYAPFYPLNGGIALPQFTGQSISYAFDGLYIHAGVSHQRPADMSWEYAARYCNWLHNGKVNEAW